MTLDFRKSLAFLSLLTSFSTLLCCALPALLVSVGLGAVMAGLAANIPGLVWISEHEAVVFTVATGLLVMNGIILYLNQNAVCPTDPVLREACLSGRRNSKIIYLLTVALFLIGAFFAFIAPKLFR